MQLPGSAALRACGSFLQDPLLLMVIQCSKGKPPGSPVQLYSPALCFKVKNQLIQVLLRLDHCIAEMQAVLSIN